MSTTAEPAPTASQHDTQLTGEADEKSVLALYDRPLTATRTGALFNAFSYPTKISPEAIALYIATHTKPGDTVLDPFAGSGTTGIAAKLCDQPTAAMLDLAREQGLAPTWGPRNAVLYDVGVLGSFIARVMCTPPDPERFRAAAAALLERAEESYGWLYETTGPDGTPGTIRHVVWSDVLLCPTCDGEITYWDACVRQEPLRLEGMFSCPGCKTFSDVGTCERATETVVDDVLGSTLQRKVRVPVVVYGTTASKNWKRSATPADMIVPDKASHEPLPAGTPIADIRWGDLYRSGYHTGISHLHHFYTPRNFLALSTVWRLVQDFDADLQDALRLLVLSFNASHSTLMTRVVVKKGQSDLVLTGAQSGVLYVSGLPVEKNIFKGLRRKAKTIAEAFSTVANSRSSVTVVNGTSTALHLEDGSVDYVFTDPPFGDYIPYAEINQINELWLGTVTKQSDEIIISPAQGKDVKSYGDMMRAVFNELSRVLRSRGRATVAFHSAKASVWQALTDAYGAAGFSPVTVSVLDKTQTSFKQTVSDVVVKGDPLILLSKVAASSRARGETDIPDVIARVLDEARISGKAEERERERLFSRFVARCLVIGLPVTIGAGEFYRMAGLDGSIA
jgi:hypothetical protein